MRYFQTNGAMAVNTTLAVGGVTYVFDANGLATAVPVINPATWVTDPATGVTIDTATGAVVPAETVAAAAAAAIAQKKAASETIGEAQKPDLDKKKGIIREQGHNNSGKTDGRSV